MKAIIAIIGLSILSGCATCREHSTACAVVGALAVSAVVISAQGSAPNGQSSLGVKRPVCSTGPC